jgi:hypothetical protein
MSSTTITTAAIDIIKVHTVNFTIVVLSLEPGGDTAGAAAGFFVGGKDRGGLVLVIIGWWDVGVGVKRGGRCSVGSMVGDSMMGTQFGVPLSPGNNNNNNNGSSLGSTEQVHWKLSMPVVSVMRTVSSCRTQVRNGSSSTPCQ